MRLRSLETSVSRKFSRFVAFMNFPTFRPPRTAIEKSLGLLFDTFLIDATLRFLIGAVAQIKPAQII